MKGLRQEVSKSVVSYSFLFCMLAATGLFFCDYAYIDNETGKSYTAVMLLLQMSKKEIFSNPQLTQRAILGMGNSDMTLAFLTILAAFPSVMNRCDERQSGLLKWNIIRLGKMRYYSAKFFSAIITGGLLLLVADFLYLAVVCNCFPDETYYYGFAGLGESVQTIVIELFGKFMYGAVVSAPAVMLSAFVRNRYLILCIPFSFYYLLYNYVQKLNIYLQTQGQASEIMSSMITIFNPKSVSYISDFLFYGDVNIGYAFVFQIALLGIYFGGYCMIMNRRFDYGE